MHVLGLECRKRDGDHKPSRQMVAHCRRQETSMICAEQLAVICRRMTHTVTRVLRQAVVEAARRISSDNAGSSTARANTMAPIMVEYAASSFSRLAAWERPGTRRAIASTK